MFIEIKNRKKSTIHMLELLDQGIEKGRNLIPFG